MNALFLKDLAAKTRRGLEGRVRQGKSGGGLCYGYDVVVETGSDGRPSPGGRRVNEVEAAIVRRIFSEFDDGRSPRAIAQKLNREHIAGPRGRPWGPSTIYGNWRRGTGVLNNELYIGQMLWNRQRFIKDPATGKRIARLNRPDQWIRYDMPELRIVAQDVWQRVKERQRDIRTAVCAESNGMRSERARRPAYLLTGLLRCGACGGGCSMVSAQHYGCSNARNRATCDNRLVIRRDALETSVLEGLKSHLMHPDLVKAFIAEYHTELNRLMAESERAGELWCTELNQVARQIRAIIDAIKEGIRTRSMQEELLALEARKVELETRIAEKPKPIPRLHPNLAEIYRQKVARLRDELAREETHVQAAGALRDLIECVRLVPENGKLEIELVGELAAILSLCEEQRSGIRNPRRRAAGVQETMVAGAGFEPVTFRL